MLDDPRRLFLIALPLALAGCGGGGGGVISTPTPPAALNGPKVYTPTGLSPSTVFSNTMQSGNFATLAALNNFSDQVTNNQHVYTQDSTISNAYISYDAPSNTYAINYTASNGSMQQDKLNAVSPPGTTVTANGVPDPTEVGYSQFICYTTGCYSNGATVTHTGAGPFVYTYLAFASVSSSSQSSIGGGTSRELDTVFGFPTAASAIPRTGSATYTLDLMAYNHGTGTGKVDFGAGTYSFSGTFDNTTNVTGGYGGTFGGTFSSTGTLASSANGFTGYIDITTKAGLVNPTATTSRDTTYRGVLGGVFFGPQAQELGGVFVASAVSETNTDPTNPARLTSAIPAFTGAILGHH